MIPVTEELNKKDINFPSSTKLKEDEIKKICNIIKELIENET